MKHLSFSSILVVLSLSACGLFPGGSELQEPTEELPEVQAEIAATEPGVLHITWPGELPAERINHAGDHDSSKTAASRQAPGGDRFTLGKYERPFNANTMDVYFPYLDIIDTFVYQDEQWAYGVITLQGTDSNGNLGGKYGIEFDLDIDGKGDWLALVSQPASSEWTTDGVQVYHDANHTVGCEYAMKSDYGSEGDGFEELVFDAGEGNDPDLAWARVITDTSPSVQIAIKLTAFENSEKYMLNMWAGNSDLDPALFDFNDILTHEQAGAADPGYELFYPIKELAELDNSCRITVGFEPAGNEPGLCETLIPRGPGAPSIPGACPSPGCPPLFHWDPISCECVEDPPGKLE